MLLIGILYINLAKKNIIYLYLVVSNVYIREYDNS